MARPPTFARKRGRPPKQKFTHPVGIADWGVETETAIRARLTKKLATLPIWKKLYRMQRDDLVAGVSAAVGHYLAALDYQKYPQKKAGRNKAGRKYDTARTVLIFDCARALERAIGTVAGVWSNDAMESPAVQIARKAHEAATGGEWPTSMRRVADRARKIARE